MDIYIYIYISPRRRGRIYTYINYVYMQVADNVHPYLCGEGIAHMYMCHLKKNNMHTQQHTHTHRVPFQRGDSFKSYLQVLKWLKMNSLCI